VLLKDRDSVKALFRRGRARAALGQTEEAIADLEAAAKRWVPVEMGGGWELFLGPRLLLLVCPFLS